VRRRQHLFDPHGLQAVPKSLTVGAIAVAAEKNRRGLVGEDVDELLSGPIGDTARAPGRPSIRLVDDSLAKPAPG
jgi:hypothetical protein